MTWPVVFSRRATAHLQSIGRYVALKADRGTAAKFVDAIVARCRKIGDVPFGGTPRDDFRRGLRTVSFRKRVTIAYRTRNDQIEIVGVYYGGRDLAAHLSKRSNQTN